MSWTRRRFPWVFPLLLLFAFLPEPGSAQTGRISGSVRDAAGEGLAAVAVTVTNRATGAEQVTTTAGNGAYSVTGVAAGTYEVAAMLFGYQDAAAVVELSPGASVTVNLSMAPLALPPIIVTAMLREQELLDVPFSVAAPSAEDLRERGVEDIEGVAANVAGFSVQNLGPGQSQPSIRGASSGQIARDQPGVKENVGVYLNDSPISLSLFTPDIDLFDMSRVEVLRGPQGTLFGAGSMGGTVRYISNQPQLGSQSVFGELTGSLIPDGGPGGNVRLGANLPLGPVAAARVVGYYTMYGGYMDAHRPVFDADTVIDYRLDEDVNSGQRFGGRAALRFQPSGRLSITPSVLYQKVEMDGWNRIDAFNILANPYTTTNPAIDLGEREQHIQIDEPFTDDFLLADLNFTFDFGPAAFTSVTSYMTRDILVVRDAGALTASITGGSIGLDETVYRIDSPLDDATESAVITQELRLGGALDFGFGAADDATAWVIGAFFSDNQREYGQSLRVAGFQDATDIPTEGVEADRDELYYSDLSYDLTQYAVFGEATVPVGSRLDLTAGLRWYNFTEERQQVFDGLFVQDPPPTGNLGVEVVSQPGETDASGIAPRFIASFEATDWLRLNAQAAKGFRLGGINDPINEPLCSAEDLALFSGQESWDDETVWNYEAGAKASLMDGRGTLTLSAYHMDITDLQVVLTAGTCSSRLIMNAPEAKSTGIEAELTLAPADMFDIALAASWADAELESNLVSSEGEEIVVPGIEPGNRLPSVPQFQTSASATYRMELVPGWPSYVTLSFQHIGSRYTQLGDETAAVDTVNMMGFEEGGGATIGGPLTQSLFVFDRELPSYNLLNARIGVMLGSWEVALFANNLTDERAFLSLDRERGLLARVGFVTNTPRVFGITLRFDI